MRVAWVGTYVPEFSRNRRLAEYLARCDVELSVTRVDLWPSNRLEAFERRRMVVWLKALVAYPLLLLKLFFQRRPDVYLVSYPGWFDLPVVKLVAAMKRRPVVFDIFISLFDTAVSDRQLVEPSSVVARLARLMDRLALRLADVVIADCPAHGRFFSSLAGGTPRVEVLYLGANEEVFRPRSNTDPVPGRVLFYGTYVPLQGAEWIVRAASILADRGVPAEFVMVGDGQERQRVEDLSRSLGGNVEFRQAMSPDQLVDEMYRASVVLGVFGTSAKANRVIPHKVFEAVACGRPVLTADTEAIREGFDDGAIATCPPGDPGALANALAELASDPARLRDLANGARAVYVRRYSADNQVQRLARILKAARRRERPGSK
ncbi:MAG: glycosyltransferase [Acidimicrobiales bacterium]|nr:glycosyltransferase [Acidimicrobiales bacterium]